MFPGPWSGPEGPPVEVPIPKGKGLALSGGGLRATLFELGVVERMYELGALDKVKFLTSVSGGSILAGLLALRWNDLLARRDSFDALIVQPICDFARSDLRDRALRRGALHLRRPIDCVAEILDEDLYHQATFAQMPDPKVLRVAFNACNLDDGKRFRFTQGSFGDLTGGYTTTAWENLPIAIATAASIAFPVGFAPLVLTLEGPWKQWDLERTFKVIASGQRQIAFADGGVFDNLGFLSARNYCDDIILVNGGEAVDVSADYTDGNPVSAAIRSVTVLMGRNAQLSIDDFLRDQSERTLKGCLVQVQSNANSVATVDFSRPDAFGKTNPELEGRFPKLAGANGYTNRIPVLLGTLRTDLDRFSDLEIEMLRYHGASLADVALRRYGCVERDEPWIDVKSAPMRAPASLPPAVEDLLREGRVHRVSELFEKFWRT